MNLWWIAIQYIYQHSICKQSWCQKHSFSYLHPPSSSVVNMSTYDIRCNAWSCSKRSRSAKVSQKGQQVDHTICLNLVNLWSQGSEKSMLMEESFSLLSLLLLDQYITRHRTLHIWIYTFCLHSVNWCLELTHFYDIISYIMLMTDANNYFLTWWLVRMESPWSVYSSCLHV